MSDTNAAPALEAPVEVTEAAPETPAVAANDNVETPAAPAEPELFELVIDGETQRLTREQLIMRAQKAEAVEKRFKEANAEKKKAAELLKLLETDPEAALAKLGKDPAKIIAEHLAKKAREALMTPEQQEKARLEEELATFKAKEAKAKADEEAKIQEQKDQANFAAVEAQMLGVAEKYQLDPTPDTLILMCEIGLEAEEMGVPITPDQLAQEVLHRQARDVEQRDRKVLSKLTDDKKLLAYLGPDIVKRVLKATIPAKTPTVTPPPKSVPAPTKPAKGFLTEAEFNAKMKKGDF